MTAAWRAFLCAFTLDRCADMLWTTTLVWLATSAESPAAQGLVVAAAMVPQVLVVLLGGAAADRFGSVRVATVTTVAKAVLIAMLLLMTEVAWHGLAVVALFAALMGMVDGFHDPAMESWGARLKRPEEQTNAASTEALLWRVGQFSGAALGGVLLGVDAVLALTTIVVLYVAQRMFLWVLRGRGHIKPQPEPSEETAREQIHSGVEFIRSRPALRATMSVQGVCTVTSGAVLMMLAPFVVRQEAWSPAVYGLAAGCFGVGMTLGILWVMRRESAGKGGPAGRVPMIAFVFVAACHAVLAVLTFTFQLGEVVLVGALLLFGLLLGPVGPLLSGYRRGITPEHQHGMLFAAARLVVQCPEPLGPVLAGIVVGISNARVGLALCAVVGVIAAAVGVLAARRAERESSGEKIEPGQVGLGERGVKPPFSGDSEGVAQARDREQSGVRRRRH